MIKLQIKQKISVNEKVLADAIAKELKLSVEDFSYKITKRSLDARDKNDIFYLYTVCCELKDKKTEDKIIARSKGKVTKATIDCYKVPSKGREELNNRPVIIGAGPAGLFAALMLSEYGFKPIVVERGEAVENRQRTVEHFWNTGELNENSNVQFGEGGAGTFSDGKLNTGVKDTFGRISHVLNTFIQYGANPEIGYVNKPHIGTDELKKVVKNIRERAIANGAEFRFNSCVTDIITDKDNNLSAIEINKKEKLPCEICVLAIGHSSRDTFKMLTEKNITLEQKPFAIGVRIEHLQELIGKGQYGEAYKQLPAADYKMTHQSSNGRGVYSFCMCPGGFVVNASSEEGKTCVNGMSNAGRNEKNANSAIVVQVNPEDFTKEGFTDILAGMKFQQKWEKACFDLTGGPVPVQRFGDFKASVKTTEFGDVIPNIKGKYEKAELTKVLPPYVKQSIIEGVESFERKLKGYGTNDAILSGVETRTSSPIRINRNEALESDIKGLYPCGEGAGYAGGIMSAAVDGIKVFEAIFSKYSSNTL